MAKKGTVRTEELEARYERYRIILQKLTLMNDVFMRNVFKKRECTEYVLQVIMNKKGLKITDQVLQKDYKKYLAEIIIDGYTDTDGDYDYNLELSQKRSLAVAQYLTEIRENFLNSDEISELQNYLTVNGHGSANPVLDSDGNVDKDASRRVEVKFRLKDDEMINELNQIMNTDKTSDSEKSGSN